ncbi:MAG TPA: right-handed parallel beta-helix repeat-containing protein [Synergistaceae bacterium]|nr:right-handed parallel beta-helix repeat-containing protein [Synergistaceae bacterium]
MRSVTKILILLLLCFFLGSCAEAAIQYVKEGGIGDASSWAQAGGNLAGVLAGTTGGDEVWVAEGTYSPGPDPLDTFTIPEGVKLYGGFQGGETDLAQRNWEQHETILHGGDVNHHVVSVASGAGLSTLIDGFTITRGSATGATLQKGCGGGMYNESASPTVKNCIFFDNSASLYGGAMINYNHANPVVENCTFADNLAQGGSAVTNALSSAAFSSCIFSENHASLFGGAMFNGESSAVVVTDCTFSKNIADMNGGGIFNDNSTSQIRRCIFVANEASGYGGGFGGGSAKVVNCTFSNNVAAHGGGMAIGVSSELDMANCTFSENTATERGGALFNQGCHSRLGNSIFWGNTAPLGQEIYNLAETGETTEVFLRHCVLPAGGIQNLVVDTGDVQVTENDTIPGNPLLEALDRNGDTPANLGEIFIYALQQGSSAVDAGLAVDTVIGVGVRIPDKDQREEIRPQGNGVDAGSYESDLTSAGAGGGGGGGCNAGWTGAAWLLMAVPLVLRKKR